MLEQLNKLDLKSFYLSTRQLVNLTLALSGVIAEMPKYKLMIMTTKKRYGTCGDNLECRHFPETGESTCVCREDKEVIGQMVVIMVVMVMMMMMTVVMVVMVVMVMCVCNACCEDKEILLFPDQGTLL